MNSDILWSHPWPSFAFFAEMDFPPHRVQEEALARNLRVPLEIMGDSLS
jgi:hypothetical protein